MDDLPEEIAARAKNIVLDLLPAKSRDQYEKEYELFKEWQVNNKIVAVSEEAVLTYLHEKSQVLKPSSLWSKYSMLKATLAVKEDIKLEKFSKVIAFLKRNAVGYEPKKSKVLSREEINTFLKEANDELYLMIKVALVIGLCGACRREELHSLQVPDIVDNGNSLVITLSDTKTHRKRVFSVTDEGESVNPLTLYHKYTGLRPRSVPHNYFFISYRKQKCTIQRVGIHTFGKMPSVVANYLKLPYPELYTGHCFRRTSATLVADAGAEMTTLKRLGGWRSTSVAEGYIEESVEQKKKVAKLIMGEKQICQSTSSDSVLRSIKEVTRGAGLSFSGSSFTNCNFSFNISK